MIKRSKQTILTVKSETNLTNFMTEKFSGMSRTSIKKLLQSGQICINGKPTTQYNYALHIGDTVLLNTGKVEYTLKDTRLKLLYEDEDLIVVDKSAGLLSVSVTADKKDTSAFQIIERYLKRKDPNAKLYVVHRLDKATSGVMMFVKNAEIQHLMRDNWKGYVTERTYIAMTEGVPYPFEDTIESYLHENRRQTMYSELDGEDGNGKLSVTHYCVVRRTGKHALVKLNLETGRKNQIRVHMHDIGCPIVGDIKYGAQEESPIGRLGLHATTLSFTHPRTEETLTFTSPLPRQFNSFMEKEYQEEKTKAQVKEEARQKKGLNRRTTDQRKKKD